MSGKTSENYVGRRRGGWRGRSQLGGRSRRQRRRRVSHFIPTSLMHEKETTPKTMRLEGEIQGIPVRMLVDNGATHNFVSKRLVCAMGREVEKTKNMETLLDDGHKAVTEGLSGVQTEIGKP